MKPRAKLRAAPPVRNLDAFLGGANEPPAKQTPLAARRARSPRSEPKTQSLPWEGPGVEREGLKVFNVRFQPRHFYMLQWLAENTRQASMQSIVLDILEPALEEAARQRLKSGIR